MRDGANGADDAPASPTNGLGGAIPDAGDSDIRDRAVHEAGDSDPRDGASLDDGHLGAPAPDGAIHEVRDSQTLDEAAADNDSGASKDAAKDDIPVGDAGQGLGDAEARDATLGDVGCNHRSRRCEHPGM